MPRETASLIHITAKDLDSVRDFSRPRLRAGQQRVSLSRSEYARVRRLSRLTQKLIVALEDRIDLAGARKALREKGSVPWSRVKKDLGL